jgi:hypothetical protein
MNEWQCGRSHYLASNCNKNIGVWWVGGLNEYLVEEQRREEWNSSERQRIETLVVLYCTVQ